ncbi:MAG TPA: YetF domain-containing protein, partial [Anaerolineaceae bacterium]|nr:YetF domain-containing protein [Anaerolineaceae bacterium]
VKIFTPDTPILEIFVRGSVMYLALFVLLRVILKREAGTVGISDLLVVVLLADAAQNGMAGNYQSISDGVLLVATIILWSYFLDWLGYRFPRIERLIHPSPLALVKDGRILRNNLRKEFITEDELMEMIREEGVARVEDVREAYMEGDGRVSVITRNPGDAKSPPKRGG